MKKIMACVIFLIFLLPVLGFSDSISVRGGYFIPRANSDLWTTEFDQMNFTKSNFQNTTLGFVYERFLNREISLCIGIEGYSQNKAGSYRDYVAYSFTEGDFAFPADYYEGDSSVSHIFNVTITPIQVSLKFAPLGRQSSFIPYVGGGLTLFIWSVRMQGQMINFEDDSWVYLDPDYGDVQIYPIVFVDARDETKFSLGYQAFAGIMVPFARRVAFEAELKYNIGKGSLTDFQGFEKFDLSGYQISLGINYWF
jgi:opacity protein-like surface antigen